MTLDFMSDLLYWITLNCTAVPNKVLSGCICVSLGYITDMLGTPPGFPRLHAITGWLSSTTRG